MSPVPLFTVAALLLVASANGQLATLSVTATNVVNFLYVDNIQITPLPNNASWRNVDTVSIDQSTRLIAIRANNVIGGCSGIMSATSNLNTNILTDGQWKCSAAAPNGWQLLGFDDSSWTPAHEVGRNGIVASCSWIPIPDFPPEAFWIWTEAFLDGDMVVSCRGYTSFCERSPCQNGGTCLPNSNDLCKCPVRFGGRYCELEINECESNPCKNGGECVLDDNGYYCECKVGYSGLNCETDITDCASEPCRNGGTCVFHVDGGYSCSCGVGFSGLNCETDIDECESEPCANGATCTDEANAVTCQCAPGYTGLLCQMQINECQSNPCQNLATCDDLVNGFECHCYPGYSGILCETGIGECASNPCQNGGTCTLGGPEGAVQCVCTPGWSGPLCTSNQDECFSNPCLNGGTCIDGESEFECYCPPMYSGLTCNEVRPNCGSILKQSIYPPARNFWALCEINIIDHGDYLNTPCSELIKDINYYNDSSTINEIGGTFGCYVTKYPDEMADGACVPRYNQEGTLGSCLSCTHMGVCIDVPPLQKKTPNKRVH